MSYNPEILGLTEYKVQSAWGTAESSGFTAIECKPWVAPVDRQMYTRDAVRSSFYELTPIVGPFAGKEFTITIPIVHGVSTSTPVADPTAHFESLVMTYLMGSSSIGGYAAGAVAASSTTTAVKIDSGTSSSTYIPGEVAVVTNGSTYEIAWLKTVTDGGGSDHTLVPRQTLGITASEGSSTYGGIVSYISATDPGFFTFRTQSLDSNSRLVLEGCVPKQAVFTLDARNVMQMTITFVCNSITASATALAATTYSYPVLPTLNSGIMTIADSAVAVQSMSLTVSQELAMVGNWNYASGMSAPAVTNRKVMLEMKRLVVGAAPLLTNATSGTAIVLQAGTSPGNMWGLSLPSGTHMEVGALEFVDGVLAQNYKYEIGQYTGDTGSTAPADAGASIVFC